MLFQLHIYHRAQRPWTPAKKVEKRLGTGIYYLRITHYQLQSLALAIIYTFLYFFFEDTNEYALHTQLTKLRLQKKQSAPHTIIQIHYAILQLYFLL